MKSRTDRSQAKVARRYAEAVLVTEDPQEYESINEAALSVGRNRLITYGCLILGVITLSLLNLINATQISIQTGQSSSDFIQTRSSGFNLIDLLVVIWLWRGANTLKHYLGFKRKLDLTR